MYIFLCVVGVPVKLYVYTQKHRHTHTTVYMIKKTCPQEREKSYWPLLFWKRNVVGGTAEVQENCPIGGHDSLQLR